MKLKKILLRYFPPGITLEYTRSNGEIQSKSIDLLTLHEKTDVDKLIDQIYQEEPLITENRKPQLKSLIQKLIAKIHEKKTQRFKQYKQLKGHLQPLTNCAFNKNGDQFLTGSYDRTCKIWDTATASLVHTLQGHKNVVYCMSFNNPYGDKVVTGSFDKTAKLWSSKTGKVLSTYVGHEAEVVCVSFDPQGYFVATGSMDSTARIWDIETGKIHSILRGHDGELVSLCFNSEGDKILTGSFDQTAILA